MTTETSLGTNGGAAPALSARRLTKSYGAPVLEDLDLDIADGEFVAVMGPSGSGKSTLMHCLSGMDRPDSGRVVARGREVTGLGEKELASLRLTEFGFVFQQAHLMATLNLLDNIVLPGFLAGLRPRDEVVERGRALMEQMGIGECASSGVTEVSGGQLQRAGICRALINDPAVLFADEPTGALNHSAATSILDLFGRVHASGTTMVVVTHDARVAARADRVLVRVDGRIVEDLRLGLYEEAAAQARLETVGAALHRHSV